MESGTNSETEDRWKTKFPQFANVIESEQRISSNQLVRQAYRINEAIITYGELDTAVYFLVDGEASVINTSDAGKITSYYTLKPGEFFGELSALDNKPRSATVIAAARCAVVKISAQDFKELVFTDRAVASELFGKLSSVIRMGNERIHVLSSFGVLQRVCLELLLLASPNEGNLNTWEIHPMPTQKEIANRIGVARETVARSLKRLVEQGLIFKNSRTLHIPDRARMEAIAIHHEPSV
jgi:CRP/FNR family cyclic AMP-dependent transcriptional regulator